MKSLFMLQEDLKEIIEKVRKTKENDDPDFCKECKKRINYEEAYDTWMKIFLLFINICEAAIESDREGNIKNIEVLERYLDNILELLDENVVSDAPGLFKCGLTKYSSGYLVNNKNSDTLELLNSKILKIKKRL